MNMNLRYFNFCAKKIMNKITEIKQGQDSLTFIFNNDDKQFAVFTKFGKTTYTSTSPGILKKTLSLIKEDIKILGFEAEVMRELYIENYGK